MGHIRCKALPGFADLHLEVCRPAGRDVLNGDVFTGCTAQDKLHRDHLTVKFVSDIEIVNRDGLTQEIQAAVVDRPVEQLESDEGQRSLTSSRRLVPIRVTWI